MKRIVCLMLSLIMITFACTGFAETDDDVEYIPEGDPWYSYNDEQTGVTVYLEANPSTGYHWDWECSAADALTLAKEEFSEYEHEEDMVGVPGLWIATFEATMSYAGDVDLTLKYVSADGATVAETRIMTLFIDESGLVEIEETIDGEA